MHGVGSEGLLGTMTDMAVCSHSSWKILRHCHGITKAAFASFRIGNGKVLDWKAGKKEKGIKGLQSGVCFVRQG